MEGVGTLQREMYPGTGGWSGVVAMYFSSWDRNLTTLQPMMLLKDEEHYFERKTSFSNQVFTLLMTRASCNVFERLPASFLGTDNVVIYHN